MAEKLTMNANLVCKSDKITPQKCVVEKVIKVYDTEFKGFLEKPMKPNYYLSRFKSLMGFYDESYHCVLFVNKDSGDGLLVNSEGADYARYSQFIPNASGIIAAHEQTSALSAEKQPLTETKLYCPLTFRIEPEDPYDDLDEVDSANYIGYVREINAAVLADLYSDKDAVERGLAVYFHDENLDQKVLSAMPGVETRNGDIYGVITVKSYGELNKVEMIDLVNDLTGQLSDGFGEGFEQREIRLGNEDVYISFWNSEDYFLKPESEVFPEQGLNQGMGGLN